MCDSFYPSSLLFLRERKTRARALFRLVWSFALEARFAFVPSFSPYAFKNAYSFRTKHIGRAKVARILNSFHTLLCNASKRERERERERARAEREREE